MSDWITQLSNHYHQQRQQHPNARLMLVFDIDGTILDMRQMMVNLLKVYDRYHGANFFKHLDASQIDAHETRIDLLLDKLQIDFSDQCHIFTWYFQQSRDPGLMLECSRAFPGVLAIIAWFQAQPNTCVGLNSDRAETLRDSTLTLLNQLGRHNDLSFSNSLLYMNKSGKSADIIASKLAGMRHFQHMHHRVIALVDNEPEILSAVARQPGFENTLLLHADTLLYVKHHHETGVGIFREKLRPPAADSIAIACNPSDLILKRDRLGEQALG